MQLISFSLLATLLASPPLQLMEPTPYRVVAYGDEALSRRLARSAGLDMNSWDRVPATTETISYPAGLWTILRFASFSLGQTGRLVIYSPEHPEKTQTFVQDTLTAWDGHTARFNGDTIRLELFRSPEEADISYQIKDLLVGVAVDAPHINVPPDSRCGSDNRKPSVDQRLGRIVPGPCTAWSLSDGRLVTAGHCTRHMLLVEFIVPDSLDDGTSQSPSPDHQFKVIPPQPDSFQRSPGQDWAVFSVVPADDGRLPSDTYGSFTVNRLPPATERAPLTVRGYGQDRNPRGETEKFNNRNLTAQKSVGRLVGRSNKGSTLMHNAYTRNGSSGSPIVMQGSGDTVGLHTHNRCTMGYSIGMSFWDSALWQAMMNSDEPTP